MPKHLKLSQPAKAGYVRHFQASNWERYTWLTGSALREKLYRWECLLFERHWWVELIFYCWFC